MFLSSAVTLLGNFPLYNITDLGIFLLCKIPYLDKYNHKKYCGKLVGWNLWNPCGIHMELHGNHVESIWNCTESTWKCIYLAFFLYCYPFTQIPLYNVTHMGIFLLCKLFYLNKYHFKKYCGKLMWPCLFPGIPTPHQLAANLHDAIAGGWSSHLLWEYPSMPGPVILPA